VLVPATVVTPRRVDLFNQDGLQLRPKARNRVGQGNIVKVQVVHPISPSRRMQVVDVLVKTARRGRLAILEGTVRDPDGLFDARPELLHHGDVLRFPRRSILGIADDIPENQGLGLERLTAAFVRIWDGPVAASGAGGQLRRQVRGAAVQRVPSYASTFAERAPIDVYNIQVRALGREILSTWTGEQLDPSARGTVRVGNVVRVQVDYQVKQNSNADEVLSQMAYAVITRLEDATGLLQARVHDPGDDIGHYYGLHHGDALTFARECIMEIPTQWPENRNIRKAVLERRTGRHRAITGFTGADGGIWAEGTT